MMVNNFRLPFNVLRTACARVSAKDRFDQRSIIIIKDTRFEFDYTDVIHK